MAKGSYQVIFSGKIIEHADLDMVKANVARVFSMPPDRIEKLFSGRRLVLKKELDQATAERYRATLQRAGALCELVDTAATVQAQTTAEPNPPGTEVAEAATEDSALSMAEVGITLVKPAEIVEANINTSGIDMADVGITLIESTPVPDANIDTSDIEMADVGITLIESTPVADANIDTSDIEMAEAGSILVEETEFLEAEFDLGELTMDEAGVQLVEPKEVVAADIDTSELSLD